MHMAGSLGLARAGTAAGLRWLVGGKACHDHVKRQTGNRYTVIETAGARALENGPVASVAGGRPV
jgi:hypothetical protein